MSKSKVYICMWDENGFETLKDCTSWKRTKNILTKPSSSVILNRRNKKGTTL